MLGCRYFEHFKAAHDRQAIIEQHAVGVYGSAEFQGFLGGLCLPDLIALIRRVLQVKPVKPPVSGVVIDHEDLPFRCIRVRQIRPPMAGNYTLVIKFVKYIMVEVLEGR